MVASSCIVSKVLRIVPAAPRHSLVRSSRFKLCRPSDGTGNQEGRSHWCGVRGCPPTCVLWVGEIISARSPCGRQPQPAPTFLEEGQRLALGGQVVLQITGPCAPCARMDEIRPGLREELEGRRGMLASVVRGGTIRAGDAIEVLEGAAAS